MMLILVHLTQYRIPVGFLVFLFLFAQLGFSLSPLH